MADYDINNPNDYVPEPGAMAGDTVSDSSSDSSLPPSAVGKGGLSAIAIAARGSPGKPNPPNLGGLVSAGGQAALEDTLTGRVRSTDQLASAKAERKGGLAKLQEALARPENTRSGIENIASGMAHNDRPWDVGNGFRQGVAGSMDANLAREKLARDSGIESAKAEMGFNSGEEKIDDGMENNALNNLSRLARPIRGAGGIGGGGVRFKNVPGTGLVDTQSVDENGVPRVVYADGKVLTEARTKALALATKEAESTENNLTFNSDAERKAWISTRADQYAGLMMANSIPGSVLNGQPANPPGNTVPGAGAQQVPGGVNTGKIEGKLGTYDFNSLDKGTFAKMPPDMQKDLIATMTANGQDTSALTVKPGLAPVVQSDLAPDGSKRIAGPEEQKARITTADGVSKNLVDGAAALKSTAETGQNMMNTVDELKQLKFNPGAFAQWKQTGGSIADAFGVKGPLVDMANQSSNANALLQALSNARISLEKGVQTRDDEVRFKAELAKITDPRDAYNYMLTHMKELGQKAQDQYNFNEQYRRDHNQNYDGADQAWQQQNKDRSGLVKRYQGSFMGRTEFINHMVSDPDNVKAYGGDTTKLQARAEKEWRNLGSK